MADPYRPYKRVLTRQEVCNLCRASDLARKPEGFLISQYRPPFSDVFSGKEFVLHFNQGTVLHYRFLDSHHLDWSENGKDWQQEEYDALPSTRRGVYMVQHLRCATVPTEGIVLIIDTRDELVTWVDLNLGTRESDSNYRFDFYFGYYGLEKQHLHGYTAELCGTILDWKYADQFVIRHEYVTPYCVLSPGEPSDNENDYLFRKTLPARYAKIRDDLYMVTFAEDDGSAFTLLIDTRRLRDIGAIIALDEKGRLSHYMIGAVAGRGTFGFTGEFSIAHGPEAQALIPPED